MGKRKKDNHVKHFHEQWKNIFPFVISFDGMLVKEVLVILANFSGLVATKMEEPISHARIWVDFRIAMTVARSYSRMIQVSCLPSPLQDRETDWKSGSGLVLAQ